MAAVWFFFACIFAGMVQIFCIQKICYEKTEYYRQTQNRFLKVQFDTGVRGEYLTWKYLRKLPGYGKVLFNCYVPKDGGETTEIDLILLHESGIYVFESKNYSGWIFGNEAQKYWTQVLPQGHGHSRKEHFFNPILQNKVHLKWLGRYLGKNPDTFYSYIIFSDRCMLKKITLSSERHHVINRNRILKELKLNIWEAGTRLQPKEINLIYEKLQHLTKVSGEQKRKHIENMRGKRNSE